MSVRRSSRLMFGAIIGLLLLLLVALLIPAVIQLEKYQPMVEERLSSRFGHPVRIRTLRLSLLGRIALTADGMEVSESARAGSHIWLRAEQLEMHFSLWEILNGGLEPSRLEMTGWKAELRSVKGRWNFLPPVSPGTSTSDTASSPAAQALPVSVPSLSFRRGRISLQDPSRAESMVVDIPDLDLDSRISPTDWNIVADATLHWLSGNPSSSDAPSAILSVTARARFTPAAATLHLEALKISTGESSFSLSGEVTGVPDEPRGQLRIQSDGASPMDLYRLAALVRGGSQPAKTEGKISFDLNLEGRLASPKIRGRFESEELRFTYADLQQPVLISRIQADLEGQRLRTNEFQASVGDRAAVILSAEVEDLDRDPAVSFRARTGQPAPLLELLRIGSSLGLRLPNGLAVEGGRAAFDLRGRGIRLKSRRFDVEGQIQLTSARIRLQQLREPLSIPLLALDLKAGTIRSNPFQVEMGQSGRLSVAFTLRDSLAGPDLQAQLKTLAPLIAGEWIEAGRQFGYRLPEDAALSGGRLDFDLGIHAPPGAEPSVQGSLSLREAAIRSRLAREPLELQRLEVEMQPDRIILKRMDALFLGSRLGATGNVHVGRSSVNGQLDLEADHANLGQLQSALAGDSAPEAKTASSSVPEAGRPVILEGRLQVGRLVQESLELAELDGRYRFERDILQLSRLRFQLYSGSHEGTLRLDLTGSLPRFQYQGKLAGVDVNPLLSRNTSWRNQLEGRLESTSAFSGAGKDSGSILKSLQGHGIYRLTNGRITTFSLGRQLTTLTRLAGWNLEGKTTELQIAEGAFRVEEGRIFLEENRIRTPEAFLLTHGSAGFDKSLDIQGTAELSDQWQLPGNTLGQVIAGATATFFRNEAGKIVVPFDMRGTLEEPVFTLNSAAIQTGLQNAMRPENIRSGVKAIGDIIDQFKGVTTTTAPGGPATTTPPVAGTSPQVSASVTTTTRPGDAGKLVESLGNLVGGILGTVQPSQPAQPAPAPDMPLIRPNVTNLVGEIQRIAALPYLTPELRRASLDPMLYAVLTALSPSPYAR